MQAAVKPAAEYKKEEYKKVCLSFSCRRCPGWCPGSQQIHAGTPFPHVKSDCYLVSWHQLADMWCTAWPAFISRVKTLPRFGHHEADTAIMRPMIQCPQRACTTRRPNKTHHS